MKPARILLIGAGIGGLTAALALQRAGFRVVVCEQACELGDVGAGLTLASNGSRIIRYLGLGATLNAYGVMPDRGAVLHYRSGALLVDIPRGLSQLDRYGSPYCQIHRADLHSALATAVQTHDPDCIRLGHRLTGCDQDSGRAVAHFANGACVEADLLVGCDGIRSIVRDQLFGEQPAHFTGYVAWRGLVPMERLPPGLIEPDSAVWTGPGRFLTRYKVRSGAVLNYVAVARTAEWAEEGWAVPSTPAEVLAEFADFCPAARMVLRQTPPESCFKWGIFEREPLKEWSRGRITLLGDAAHPITPFLGQGAVMAIEDGMVLARTLASADSLPEGLQRYEAARVPRSTRVMVESKDNGAQLTGFDPDSYDEAAHRNEETLDLASYDAVTVSV